jgi:GLPGLI family protein
LFSQNNSGEIVYCIRPIIFEVKSNADLQTKEFVNSLKLIAEKQKFVLKFKNSESSFVREATLVSDEDKDLDKLAFIRFTSEANYFVDKTNNFEICEHIDGQLEKKENVNINWEITTESKKIDEYICYKALYNKKFIARDGKEKTTLITAWYAPSLPYSFGPKDYFGLPGLILELQEKETTFYATNIKFLSDDKINIKFPTGKIISEEQYKLNVINGLNNYKEK